ncbi:hypothetical protein HJG60_011560 [Phyllostomus discolor]|uniref:Uncharacterized protein n=1 Tax=Phyllostomus discolor TaxID=89673 RepID=A0A834E0X6_9CHIR|nr:hypothetical protein HJG60_011560 [Phyllostomus discolor]
MTLWFKRETMYVMLDMSCKKTHQDTCIHGQNSHVSRLGQPTEKLLGKFPTCYQGCQVMYQETQKAGVHHFQGITEACSRLLLRQVSSTHQSVAPYHMISLGISHWRLCPAGLRTSSTLLATWLERSFLARL